MWQKFDSGTYHSLKTSVRKRMIQGEKVNERLLEIVQVAYQKALSEQKIVLSPPEIKKMQEDILKEILTDLLAKVDKQ
jgi:hypothetical protein